MARHVDRYESDFFLSRLTQSDSLHVACMYLRPGGLVGNHRAVSTQLFAVVDGEGWVRGAQSERVSMAAGEAVLWESGEEHEAGTETGMTAIVIEGDMLSAGSKEIGPPELHGEEQKE